MCPQQGYTIQSDAHMSQGGKKHSSWKWGNEGKTKPNVVGMFAFQLLTLYHHVKNGCQQAALQGSKAADLNLNDVGPENVKAIVGVYFPGVGVNCHQ